MKKKLIGLSLVTLVFTVAASASTMQQYCGGDTLTNTSTGFPDPFLTGFGISCASFTVPTGYTLTSVDLTINDDFSSAFGTGTSTSQLTYTFTGFSLSQLTSTVSGIGSSGAPAFTGTGCTLPGTFGNATAIDCTDTSVGVPSTTSFNGLSISVSETWSAGGLQSNGAETINISEFFTYTPTVSTPEPASLMMIGGGLIGLAMLARRKRSA
jgi:hypothetical protein